MAPPENGGWRVLDLGGNRGQFSLRLLERSRLDITVADVIDFTEECAQSGLRFVQLPSSGRLPFADREFDVVFSNSVIEHVTLDEADCRRTDLPESEWRTRAFAHQREFAAEIARIGRGYFVQTPHRHFPLDLHLWLPLTNWFAHRTLVRLARVTDRLWVKQVGLIDWHLLGSREMRVLFPTADLHVERAFGLPKSLIAYKRPS